MSMLHSNAPDLKIAELQYQVAVYEDETAYKKLFFLLFPSIQNFAFSFTRSRALAEEIASDLLMDVWIRRKKLMEIENLKLYLFVGAKHAAIHKLKQENRFSGFSLDDLQVEFISDYVNPDVSAELHEMQEHIAKAVKALPPSCQLIYKLAKEDRLKYKDIAALLDLSVKTIDHQLSIALKKIAIALHYPNTKKNES
ncbi:MAG: sigma-70 family RNA polymerase sigma factor [Chitinophagaceae bacterium]|nr:MAG: sigma-70 family RNA polymerase sigma factor [Chitinophagaceae bacterium]